MVYGLPFGIYRPSSGHCAVKGQYSRDDPQVCHLYLFYQVGTRNRLLSDHYRCLVFCQSDQSPEKRNRTSEQPVGFGTQVSEAPTEPAFSVQYPEQYLFNGLFQRQQYCSGGYETLRNDASYAI